MDYPYLYVIAQRSHLGPKSENKVRLYACVY